MIRAALLSVMLASCGAGNIECTIDGAFDPSSTAEIQRAANAWNAWTMTKIAIVDRGEWLILPAPSPDGYLGRSTRSRRIVRIDPHTPPEQVYAVALHELGHVHGLRHTSRGVMDPSRQTEIFSDEDVRECERVDACEVP